MRRTKQSYLRGSGPRSPAVSTTLYVNSKCGRDYYLIYALLLKRDGFDVNASHWTKTLECCTVMGNDSLVWPLKQF